MPVNGGRVSWGNLCTVSRRRPQDGYAPSHFKSLNSVGFRQVFGANSWTGSEFVE